MLYRCDFIGVRKGALGQRRSFTKEVLAENVHEAEIRLYESYDHISDLKIQEWPGKTYRIVRFFAHTTDRKIIGTGLSIEEAREHCQRPDTSKAGEWFDAFEEE